MGSMDGYNLYLKLARLESDNLSRVHGEPRDDLLKKVAAAEHEARRLKNAELIAISLMRRADILMSLGRDEVAVDALEKARQELGDSRQPDLAVFILGMLAEAHAHREDWQTVSTVCDEGIKLVESYRYKTSGQYLQSAYLRFRIGLYTLGVRAAYELSELGDYRLMVERAELSKSRLTLLHPMREVTGDVAPLEQEFRAVCEQIDSARAQARGEAPEELLLKRRTLWDLLLMRRYHGVTGESIPKFSLEAVQAALCEDEAIVYYYWLDKNALLIVTIDQQHIIPELRLINQPQRVELEAFTQFVLKLQSSSGYLDKVQSFSSLLLPQEATSLLDKKQRLLFSPHRLLHAIPFHALKWQDDFLIQRFAITYIPNLTSLLFRYSPAERQRVLALGICDYQVPGQKLTNLKEAEEEVKDLESLYGKALILIKGADATEGRLQQLDREGELEKFTCLHLAVHGDNIQSDTPMESRLFLRDTILEGLEIANWKLNANLIVLSACCSGQRPISGRGMDELPGDDLFGLQAAFFAAGAKRTICSLWPVESSVARSMTVRFHGYIANGLQPELALQAAVIDYLKTAGTQKRKVYYWAPFFLSAMGRASSKNQER